MANKNTHLDNFCTKERSTNFHRVEVERLQNLIEKYKHILLCKKTDAISSKQKEHTWNCIEKEFNAVGETPRSIKQLKYKFDNMKRTVKKEASKERQQMIKTGGGRLTPPPPLSPSQENDMTKNNRLRSILSTSVDGNEAVYDDDITAKVNYPSTQCFTRKKNNVLDGLHDLELQKIRESIIHQRELHNQQIRHNEEKHNMEIIKLQLEIDILQSKKDSSNKIN